MAHKSKTQRQKAAVAKANKKDRQMREEAAAVNDTSKDTEDVGGKRSSNASVGHVGGYGLQEG